MVDLHCHILPGLDDGPRTMEESVAMARIAAEDGITSLVAAPHINYELIPHERINALVEDLNMNISKEGIGIRILAGADVNAVISPVYLDGYTINSSRYILIEFSHTHMPANARENIFGLSAAGFRPIVTHPERNVSVIENPSIAAGLVESGALIQLTASSLTGGFGRHAKRCSERLLGEGLVHFIATDGHSHDRRPPILSEALRKASSIIGEEAAMTMVRGNPQTVIDGGRVVTQV